MLASQFSGLVSFILYFSASIVLLIAFKYIYTWVTPHDEWKLIKEEKNTAAAIGFGGSIIGFVLAIASVISNSLDIVDFAIWSVVATFAQLVAYGLVRVLYMPKIVIRLQQGEVSAGIMLAVISIAVGLLNAACMTY